MPAPFAAALCGYRAHGKPNTSDASEAFSVELGRALFEVMGVAADAKADEQTGATMALSLAADLRKRLAEVTSGLVIAPEKSLKDFDQFRHVAILRRLRAEPTKEVQKSWRAVARFLTAKVTEPSRDVDRARELIDAFEEALETEVGLRRQIIEDLGEESLLKLDVTASRPGDGEFLPHLEVGLSLKWSLRTDRAQDCRSQGAKMSALRRGRMPHFAAVTMEPRPYMLNLLGGGSGEVDCVYHLDLPSLALAIDETCSNKGVKRAKTKDTFRRLVQQRRLRDYNDLVAYTRTL